MRSKFLTLLLLSFRAKKIGNRNFPKSILGKDLEQEFNNPPEVPAIQLNPGIYNPDGSPQIPPIPYEVEHNLS